MEIKNFEKYNQYLIEKNLINIIENYLILELTKLQLKPFFDSIFWYKSIRQSMTRDLISQANNILDDSPLSKYIPNSSFNNIRGCHKNGTCTGCDKCKRYKIQEVVRNQRNKIISHLSFDNNHRLKNNKEQYFALAHVTDYENSASYECYDGMDPYVSLGKIDSGSYLHLLIYLLLDIYNAYYKKNYSNYPDIFFGSSVLDKDSTDYIIINNIHNKNIILSTSQTKGIQEIKIFLDDFYKNYKLSNFFKTEEEMNRLLSKE